MIHLCGSLLDTLLPDRTWRCCDAHDRFSSVQMNRTSRALNLPLSRCGPLICQLGLQFVVLLKLLPVHDSSYLIWLLFLSVYYF